jgi:diadenosine tetraphosphate (Ap4A) HIT family hydrolase
MVFVVDNRILASSIWICDSNLSSVFIKNDANFLWFILVPRVPDVEEIYQLSPEQQKLLMDEITHLSRIVSGVCNPDKLNVGALGNIVSQLHVHVIARFKEDAAWPHGVWQPSTPAKPYDKAELERQVAFWQLQIIPELILCKNRVT